MNVLREACKRNAVVEVGANFEAGDRVAVLDDGRLYPINEEDRGRFPSGIVGKPGRVGQRMRLVLGDPRKRAAFLAMRRE